jgi:hypothetical protein
MPSRIQLIPLRTTDLGADRTPDLVGLMSLSKLLINLIFKASKA